MRRAVALQILAEHEAELRAQGVRSLLLFGSVARDEARPDSDVDLIVEFERPVGLFALSGLKFDLEEWLKTKVDLVTLDSIPRPSREGILSEALRAA